jgi:hypothetical protein
MKKILTGLLFWVGICMGYGQTFTLKYYQWKQRVLLVFTPDATQPLLQQQLNEINQDKTGYSERDLVVIRIYATTMEIGEEKPGVSSAVVQQLRTEFQVDADAFCVILLGKDGGEKLRSTKVIPTRKLFDVIDAMPMRKNEKNQ